MAQRAKDIADWMREQASIAGARGFVVGLSGGVDSAVVARLCQLAAPANVVGVSESGLQTRADLERLAASGYRAFLIGERFMTDPDPARAIADLIGARV